MLLRHKKPAGFSKCHEENKEQMLNSYSTIHKSRTQKVLAWMQPLEQSCSSSAGVPVQAPQRTIQASPYLLALPSSSHWITQTPQPFASASLQLPLTVPWHFWDLVHNLHPHHISPCLKGSPVIKKQHNTHKSLVKAHKKFPIYSMKKKTTFVKSISRNLPSKLSLSLSLSFFLSI